MSAAQKDTIYIDVDDEITSIIEKISASKNNIVALVLPKRAAALQSIVNMKLLKRAADDSKKKLVLITSESALLPLAGNAGLHVAKTLQSLPSVPDGPTINNSPLKITSDQEAYEIDPTKPVGVLAGDIPEDEPIQVDYDDKPQDQAAITKKEKRNKKLKIPNFEKFRIGIIAFAVLLILLIIGSYWAINIAPKAKVTIKTDTNSVVSNLDITASPSASSLDESKLITTLTNLTSKKTDTQKVPATGKQDQGTKASGKATLTLTDCSQPQVIVPAGTSITANSLSFITQSAVTLSSITIAGKCRNSDFPDVASGSVNVAAQNAGDQYNLSARNYVVDSFNNVTASGSAMSGGTSKILTVVSQQDVDSAKQQILDRTKTLASTELKKQMSDQIKFALVDSLTNDNPTITSAPAVGDPAPDSNVVVTLSTTYTMTGVPQADLKTLLQKDLTKKIDPATQTILDSDDGLGKAVVKLGNKSVNGDIKFNIQTTVNAGPQLDADAIKKEIAGKKKGDSTSIIQKRPGIKDVSISYSPFWVYTTPHNLKKITVVFVEADGS